MYKTLQKALFQIQKMFYSYMRKNSHLKIDNMHQPCQIYRETCKFPHRKLDIRTGNGSRVPYKIWYFNLFPIYVSNFVGFYQCAYNLSSNIKWTKHIERVHDNTFFMICRILFYYQQEILLIMHVTALKNVKKNDTVFTQI